MFNRISATWHDLSRTIYTGNRLKANLRALTAVSLFTMLLGATLIALNLVHYNLSLLIPSAITFLGGAICALLAGVRKNREFAILVPILFCLIAFTYYAPTGAGSGTGILWSLLVPIGLGYFVSVKCSILVSLYYILFYSVLFYSPLREYMTQYYSEEFITRFPLVFASMAGFSSIAMIQYHRSVLLENDYTDRLNAEVAKQTAVAEERTQRIEEMSLQTIQTLAHAIDAKDAYTRGHSTRVSAYSVRIAEALGWDKEQVNDLRFAAMLHDIGKIGVPDSILNNPKRLTDVEFDIIKSHTTIGGEILRNRVMIKAAEDVALSHHERYDGSGYPRGLKGREISVEARIVAIADAFDAMSSNRIYRKACDDKYIRREMIAGREKQFDPALVDVFIDLWDRGLLDDIMKEDTVESSEKLEASSALLQDVMESFAAQSSGEEIDITTGILNRTAGEAAIAQAMTETAGCYVFFDVDNLKKINDTIGHEAGDRLLRLMGDTLAENSENALCCRLGGDEFIFFIKETSTDRIKKRIETIIEDFEEKKSKDLSLAVASLSAGAVLCTPDDTYENIYIRADKALYQTKQSGKHGYGFYSEETEGVVTNPEDTKKMIHALRDSGSYEGALDVEYRQFTKLYEFIGNLERRFSHQFRLILISLDPAGEQAPHDEDLERAMFYMEQSIMQTIRDVDVVTRYNRQQFLVILLGTEPEGVRIATDRIFRGYYKMYGSSIFSPSYTEIERDVS